MLVGPHVHYFFQGSIILYKMALTKGGYQKLYHLKKDRQYNDQKTVGQIYKLIYRKLNTRKQFYELKPKRTPTTFLCYERKPKRTPTTFLCYERKPKRTPTTFSGQCWLLIFFSLRNYNFLKLKLFLNFDLNVLMVLHHPSFFLWI